MSPQSSAQRCFCLRSCSPPSVFHRVGRVIFQKQTMIVPLAYVSPSVALSPLSGIHGQIQPLAQHVRSAGLAPPSYLTLSSLLPLIVILTVSDHVGFPKRASRCLGLLAVPMQLPYLGCSPLTPLLPFTSCPLRGLPPARPPCPPGGLSRPEVGRTRWNRHNGTHSVSLRPSACAALGFTRLFRCRNRLTLILASPSPCPVVGARWGRMCDWLGPRTTAVLAGGIPNGRYSCGCPVPPQATDANS